MVTITARAVAFRRSGHHSYEVAIVIDAGATQEGPVMLSASRGRKLLLAPALTVTLQRDMDRQDSRTDKHIIRPKPLHSQSSVTVSRRVSPGEGTDMSRFSCHGIEISPPTFRDTIETWCRSNRTPLCQLSERAGLHPNTLKVARARMKGRKVYTLHHRTIDGIAAAMGIEPNLLIGSTGEARRG
jgi:hypothetical protein